jgi:hypothetical protein
MVTSSIDLSACICHKADLKADANKVLNDGNACYGEMEPKNSESLKKMKLVLFYSLPLPTTLLSPEGIGIDVNEPALKLYRRSKKSGLERD